MPNYISIQSQVSDQIEIKKSNFQTYLFPVKTEADCSTHLQALHKDHPKANHHCFAYILGEDQNIQRMSDDGEPAGTAGPPILEVLKQEDLTNLLAIVVRYFGGVKLGAGGLIRAYSTAVSQALKKAHLIQNINQMLVDVTLAYPQVDRFNYELSLLKGKVTPIDQSFTDQVTFKLAIKEAAVEEVKQHLNNCLNGQLTWQELGIQTIDIPFTKDS